MLHPKHFENERAHILVEIAGWYGAVVILLAYALNSFEVITTSSFLYIFLNITGSIGIIVIAWYKRVYQSVVLNVIWAVIALIALLRIFSN